MPKALLPVDGSPASLRAVAYAIESIKRCQPTEIVLVNVQPPVNSWELTSHLRPAEIEAMQESKGGDALAGARKLLEDAGLAYEPRVLLGPVAETLVAFARDSGCNRIIMGNKGESFIEEAVTGSVAHAVLRLTGLPVTFVK